MKDTESIRLVINSIENSLYDELDIKKISALGYISVAQLYRDFYSVTGHSVKEYIRKRRLSNALALVRHSQLSIADIAERCGYTSIEVFYKAVKRAARVTPAAYRNGEGFYYFPSNSGRECRQTSVIKISIPETFRVYCVSGVAEAECVQLFRKSFPRFDGRLFGRDGRSPGYYELYASAKPDENKAYTRLPAFTGTFATTTVENTPAEIQSAWDYLYYDWLEASMFRHAQLPFFEEYLFTKGEPKKLRLYIPVEKREGTVSITVEKMGRADYLACFMRGETAEERASAALLEYLEERRAEHDFINTAEQIYICSHEDEYACGIRLGDPSQAETPPPHICMISTDGGEYAVLSGRCCGEYRFYADTLSAWARETLGTAGQPFAIYDISHGIYNTEMKIYCKIKEK